jgi:hypothetical protein
MKALVFWGVVVGMGALPGGGARSIRFELQAVEEEGCG